LSYLNTYRLEYIELRSSFKKLLEFAGVIYGTEMATTVNKEMHIDVPRRLRDAVRRKRPEK